MGIEFQKRKEQHMQMKIKIAVIVLLTGCLQWGLAQEEGEDIGTETVTVTKAYTPSISDAFKIKSFPVTNDSIELQKKKLKYKIHSIPVASTFTPAKGKATAVKKTPPPELFNSYASFGFGSYANALAEFYTSRPINRDQRLDIGFDHNSSRGNIDGVALDNIFSDSEISGSYSLRDRDYDWGANVGFQHQIYNWYGLPEDIDDPVTINGIDERQQYFMGEAGAYINLEDTYIKSGSFKYRRFWDAVKSGENRVILGGALDFPLGEESLNINLNVDYLNGTFANASLNNPNNDTDIKYSQFQVGINPSLAMLRDDLSLKLGVNFVYGMDTEASEGSFYIYPAVTASYRLVGETVIAYGGIEGQLKQNSYYGFVDENPFVSPTLSVAPTDSQYDAYGGVKGQLLPNLGYNVRISYVAENNRPLFKLNPSNSFRSDDKGYYYGNSFEVFYDDVKTIGFFGELNVDVNRNFTFRLNGSYSSYTTETDNPAWNLPKLEGNLFFDYQIGEKWFLGANLFYVGEREDVATQATLSGIPSDFPATAITLDGYFDANAHVGHRLNNQLSVFLRASNIANNKYQRWANYRVQGFQILGGATYKFDF
ncbi:MAG: TonB-dependent receptor [Flavobacteriaceae bacterium]